MDLIGLYINNDTIIHQQREVIYIQTLTHTQIVKMIKETVKIEFVQVLNSNGIFVYEVKDVRLFGVLISQKRTLKHVVSVNGSSDISQK